MSTHVNVPGSRKAAAKVIRPHDDCFLTLCKLSDQSRGSCIDDEVRARFFCFGFSMRRCMRRQAEVVPKKPATMRRCVLETVSGRERGSHTVNAVAQEFGDADGGG